LHLVDVLQNYETVKYCKTEQYELSRFVANMDRINNARRVFSVFNAFKIVTTYFGYLMSNMGTALLCALEVAQGTKTAGELILCIVLTKSLTAQVRPDLVLGLRELVATASRVDCHLGSHVS
jgi:ABC-type transport system involved in Fe-S cluster assembly fused permease/ATPase subunit